MTYIALFVMVFCAGPLLFLRLIRPVPSWRQFRALVSILLGCLALSLLLRFGRSGVWGQDAVQTWAGMILIWAAWVSILALVVQRLRAVDPRPPMRRWSAIFGAIGTTVPWFGLAAARMMSV